MAVASKSGPSPTRSKWGRRSARLSREQLALVHVARRDRNLAEDEYRKLLNDAAGVSSSKDLTLAGFSKVMDRFKAIGFVHRAGSSPAAAAPASFGARAGMATEPQIELIRRLWAQWHGAPDERSLNAWLAKRFGVSNLRFATLPAAQMVIEGLKAMTSRQANNDVSGARGHTDQE